MEDLFIPVFFFLLNTFLSHLYTVEIRLLCRVTVCFMLPISPWRNIISQRVYTISQAIKIPALLSVSCYSIETRMKRMQVLIGLLMTVLMISSCKPSLKVTSEYDKTVDFKRFKTFVLTNSESLTKAMSQLNHDRVLNAVRSEMKKKGYKEDSVVADILINVNAVFNVLASASGNNYYEYGSVYRPYTWGPGISYTNYDVRHYKDGSLIIDIVDASAKKLLWQGTGSREVDTPLKHPDKEIPKAVTAIMAGFPPSGEKK
jgi:hypothetical protein